MFSILLTADHSYNGQNSWDFVLSHWAPEQIYLMGPELWSSKTFSGAIRVECASELPAQELVLLAPQTGRYVQGVTSLIDFVHPANPIYWFGSDHTHMFLNECAPTPDHLVYVPTETTVEMYSHTAAAVTLYDRAYKLAGA